MIRGTPMLLLAVLSCAAPPPVEQLPRENLNAESAAADSVVRWLASNAVRLSTVEPGSDFDDLQALGHMIGDARIVALGRPTQANREIFRFNHRLFEFLVRERGFDVFALEAPMPEALDINEYVLTGSGNPAMALAGITMWTSDTEEVLELIEWMRHYNADPANTRKLSFYRLDMQSPERAARVTLEFLERVDSPLAEVARAKLGGIAVPFSDPDSYGYRPLISRETDTPAQETIQAVLASMDARRDGYISESSREEWAFVRQHAQVLASWIEANRDGGRDYVAVRERTMTDHVRWILDREGEQSKILMWGHNARIADDRGYDHLGRRLRRMFGDELVIVGSLFNRGGFRAVEAAVPSRGLRSFSVGPAPEGTVEALFEAAGLEIAAVDLRRIPPTGAVAEWFRAPRPIRYSGGDYADAVPEAYFRSYLVPEAFDVLIFVDSTTPARTLNPADYETLPVLPAAMNLDFESGRTGEAPEDWIVWSKLRRLGFEVTTSAERPYSGRHSAVIRREPGQYPGEAAGSLLQRVDATPYRGNRIRLRAAARAEVPGDEVIAFLRLQIHPAAPDDVYGIPEVIFDSLDEYRVTSSEWRIYEIVADVPEDAVVISYGLFLAGNGAAWLDDVRIQTLER